MDRDGIPHGVPDDRAEAMILASVGAAPGRLTLIDLLAELGPRLGERGTRPTAGQIAETVRRLLADGRLIDTADPRRRGSKHFLTIPPTKPRETAKGLFDE